MIVLGISGRLNDQSVDILIQIDPIQRIFYGITTDKEPGMLHDFYKLEWS